MNYVGKHILDVMKQGVTVVNTTSHFWIASNIPYTKKEDFNIFVDIDEHSIITAQYDLNNLSSFFFTSKELKKYNQHYYNKFYFGVKAVNLDHAIRALMCTGKIHDFNNLLVTTKKPMKLKPALLIKNIYLEPDYVGFYIGPINSELVISSLKNKK